MALQSTSKHWLVSAGRFVCSAPSQIPTEFSIRAVIPQNKGRRWGQFAYLLLQLPQLRAGSQSCWKTRNTNNSLLNTEHSDISHSLDMAPNAPSAETERLCLLWHQGDPWTSLAQLSALCRSMSTAPSRKLILSVSIWSLRSSAHMWTLFSLQQKTLFSHWGLAPVPDAFQEECLYFRFSS